MVVLQPPVSVRHNQVPGGVIDEEVEEGDRWQQTEDDRNKRQGDKQQSVTRPIVLSNSINSFLFMDVQRGGEL